MTIGCPRPRVAGATPCNPHGSHPLIDLAPVWSSRLMPPGWPVGMGCRVRPGQRGQPRARIKARPGLGERTDGCSQPGMAGWHRSVASRGMRASRWRGSPRWLWPGRCSQPGGGTARSSGCTQDRARPVPLIPSATDARDMDHRAGAMSVPAMRGADAFCVRQPRGARSPRRCVRRRWWARQGLNLRPLRCQHSALPLSYAPTVGSNRRAGLVAQPAFRPGPAQGRIPRPAHWGRRGTLQRFRLQVRAGGTAWTAGAYCWGHPCG